jgi:ABC-type transport system involved in multi-copper enzyme maturation permease subunit
MASSGLSVGALDDLRETLEQNVLLTLFLHEVKQGFRSWLYRVWIGFTFFIVFLFLMTELQGESEGGSSIFMILAYFTFAGTLYSVVIGSAAISGEVGGIADSLLSKAVRRWEYILSKYLSQFFLVLFVYFLMVGLTSFMLWSFDRIPDDMDWFNATVLFVLVAMVLVLFTSVGVVFSTMASRTVFAFLMGIMIWFILIFMFMITNWESIYSPIAIIENFDRILDGIWDVDWWKLAAYYVGAPLACFGVSLLFFYQRDL